MDKRIIAGLAMAAAAHAWAQAPQEVGEQSHALSAGATATLGKGVGVTLDSVDDDRCPKGQMCVQRGRLAYHFTLRTPERTERFTLSDESPSYTSEALGGATLAMDPGAAVEAPARDSGARPAPTVTLQVIRK